jgi:hypothetical protein
MIPLRDNSRLGRAPFVTIALVVANVVVYVLATRTGRARRRRADSERAAVASNAGGAAQPVG